MLSILGVQLLYLFGRQYQIYRLKKDHAAQLDIQKSMFYDFLARFMHRQEMVQEYNLDKL